MLNSERFALAAAGRGKYLINSPGLVAESIMKRVSHHGKDRIGDRNLSRYGMDTLPYEEAKK